ncbi:hypothetical protein KM043_014245 [Ampulex compressa]|nr:hypothetical protein KM043_014245 [Ampulex compressa]
MGIAKCRPNSWALAWLVIILLLVPRPWILSKQIWARLQLHQGPHDTNTSRSTAELYKRVHFNDTRRPNDGRQPLS